MADRQVALRHPLYLDVPMMTSFLAYLEGGVAQSFEQVLTRTREARSTSEAGADFKVGLPASVSVSLSGKLGDSGATGGTDEHRVQRQHTSASLFNLLLDLLTDANIVQTAGADALDQVAPGTLVRVNGVFVGNPLEKFLNFANQMIPFLEPEAPEEKRSGNPRSGNPAKRTTSTASQNPLDVLMVEQQKREAASTRAMLTMIRQMHTDSMSSPVSDVLIRANDDLNVVATASREFMTPSVAAQLESSSVSLVGKVTLVGKEDRINLMRRTVFVMASEDDSKNMFSDLPGLGSSPQQLHVEPPYLQVMPLAIYV